MNTKSAAGMIVLAALLLSSPVRAQEEIIGGSFYAGCGPAGGPAVTMDLDNHLRITVYGGVEPDGVYRTKAETFGDEKATMEVGLCDKKLKNCKAVEGVLTTYDARDEVIEAAIEYFDGTEVQGDSESIQGHTFYFKLQPNKEKKPPVCR